MYLVMAKAHGDQKADILVKTYDPEDHGNIEEVENNEEGDE